MKFIKSILGTLFALITLLVILPNVINQRERQTFSQEARLETARGNHNVTTLKDSVRMAVTTFYDRGAVVGYLLSEEYRDIWATEVSFPVFSITDIKGGLTPQSMGGGQQTISSQLVDAQGREYSLRSVNKDQARALPEWLRYTVARPMFRDAAHALNPFAAPVVARLASAADILHTNPTVYLVPYDENMEEQFRAQLAGRVMLLEEEPGKSWKNTAEFDSATSLVSTKKMLKKRSQGEIVLDTLEYARCRLFDMLLSDWDKHERQWSWAIYDRDSIQVCRPLPMDRDMAFYDFGDGLINQLALNINNKFQSFEPEYGEVSGLMKNSDTLDRDLLANITLDQLTREAHRLQDLLPDSVISEAFSLYPPEIFSKIGEEHIDILKARRAKLLELARDVYDHLQSE